MYVYLLYALHCPLWSSFTFLLPYLTNVAALPSVYCWLRCPPAFLAFFWRAAGFRLQLCLRALGWDCALGSCLVPDATCTFARTPLPLLTFTTFGLLCAYAQTLSHFVAVELLCLLPSPCLLIPAYTVCLPRLVLPTLTYFAPVASSGEPSSALDTWSFSSM